MANHQMHGTGPFRGQDAGNGIPHMGGYMHQSHFMPPDYRFAIQHPHFPPHLPQQFVHPQLPFPQSLPMPINTYSQLPNYQVMPNQHLPPNSGQAPAASSTAATRTDSQPVQSSAKLRPNREVRPGVFAFEVDIHCGENKLTFWADTDMKWIEFRDRVCDSLSQPKRLQLSARIGDGKFVPLNSVEGLESFMQKIVQKAQNARTKPVTLEVKNAAPLAPVSKGKQNAKRTRKDDVPPDVEPGSELNGQYSSFKQLSEETRCEAHHGHCYVSRRGGTDNHRRLSHQEMTLWAKKMSLNEATKYAPPHCLNFDRGPTMKTGRRSASTSSIPEVHVTIQNIRPEPLISSSPTTPQTVCFKQTTEPAERLQLGHRTSSPNLTTSNSLMGTWAPFVPYQSSTIQESRVFPPVSHVIQMASTDRPAECWNRLEEYLVEAGVTSSEHILLADQTVLAYVGNMGPKQVTILRNCAKQLILPLLGLSGTYQEDENIYVETSENRPANHKRPYDFGEAVVRNLCKKAKMDNDNGEGASSAYEANVNKFEVATIDQQFPTLEDLSHDYSDSNSSTEDDELFDSDAEGEDEN